LAFLLCWNFTFNFLPFSLHFLSFPLPLRPPPTSTKTFSNYRRTSKKNEKKSDFLIPSLFFIINLTSQFLRASGFLWFFLPFHHFILLCSQFYLFS
jgi:hypothetical protein